MPEYATASVPRVQTNLKAFLGSHYADEAPTYGMGVYQGRIKGHHVIEHWGQLSGYRSAIGRYPDCGLSFAILTNSTEGETLCAWLRGVLPEALLGEQVPNPEWELQ